MKDLVLLGAGPAHLHVLAQWARMPGALGAPAVRLTLVSPFARFLHPAMLAGWVAGRLALESCAVPLLPLVQSAQATLVESAAAGLDAAARTVRLANGQTLRYDVLSIDTGPAVPRDAIDGAREHALFMRPLEHLVPLWERVVALAQERPLGIVVIGGAAAGVELALAMEQRLGPRSRVSLVTGLPGLLPGWAPGARRRVGLQLRRRRISVLEADAARIEAAHVVLANGTRLVCDAPVMAMAGGAPPWLAGSGLALDAQGRILTGSGSQSLSHAEVFGSGEVAVRPEVNGARQPYGQRSGAALAANLRLRLAGGVLRAVPLPRRALHLLAAGDGSAIGAWGHVSWSGRWVGAWKDRIDRAFIDKYTGHTAEPEPGS